MKTLIAIAPRWRRMQLGFLEAFEDPRTDELWIIGAARTVFWRIMWSLRPRTAPPCRRCATYCTSWAKTASSGHLRSHLLLAVRWDVEQEFIFHKHPLARSSSSITRIGQKSLVLLMF